MTCAYKLRSALLYGHPSTDFLSPKNRGPDQRVPVIVRAILLRLLYRLPSQVKPFSSIVTSWVTPCHSRIRRVPGLYSGTFMVFVFRSEPIRVFRRADESCPASKA